jgi:hypothetical protein
MKDKKDRREKTDECTANKPLLMYIPDEGAVIKCPVHGEHRIYGARVKF